MTPGARPLRLLVVGVRWPPETFIQRRLRGLAERGLEVTVCGPTAHGAAAGGIRLIPMPAELAWLPLRALALAGATMRAAFRAPCDTWRVLTGADRYAGRSRRRLHRLLSVLRAAADVVHFEWNSAAVEFLPVFDLLRCPIVISCRGAQIQVAPHDPRRAGFTSRIPETFAAAAAVHCVSNAIRDEAIGLGLDPRKASVIRPAVDPSLFMPRAPRGPRGELRIISVGSLIWRKGYEYALLAVAELRKRGVAAHLDILGDGEERERLLYTIEDLGLQGHVSLRGALPPVSVGDALGEVDTFLLSSVSEGISNAALEAMACGLPLVTTDCGGMREAVTDGREGLVVPPRDPGAMATALARLAADAGLSQRMGRAARDRVVREFNLERQIDSFVELYQSVTAG